MTLGRPKLDNPHNRRLEIRLSEEQFQEICQVAEKNKISRTEAILRGIKLLKNPPRQIITRSQLPGFVPKKIPKHSEGVEEGEVVWFDKK